MKTFISDMKWMFKVDKETFKMSSIMMIAFILINYLVIEKEEDYFFLIYLLAPFAIVLVKYFSVWRPLFRKAEEKLRLQNKYSFLYNKFIEEEKI